MPKLELTGKFAKLTITVCTSVWDFSLIRAGWGGGVSWDVRDPPSFVSLFSTQATTQCEGGNDNLVNTLTLTQRARLKSPDYDRP